MSFRQSIALALVCALSALDGYDVLALSFAAPGISVAWALSPASLGLVLSSGLVGMALGSLLLAPLADIFGRRRLVICNLVLMGLGMFASASAATAPILAAWRLITGVGIGAMVPVITPLAFELVSHRRRAFGMAMLTIGFPIGGSVGGFAAAILLHWFRWPSVFLFGGLVAVLLLPLTLVWLPESFCPHPARRDALGLSRVRGWLARFEVSPITEIPPAASREPARWRAIFRVGQCRRTLAICAANLLYLITTYFVLSWMPKIVSDDGFSPSMAAGLSGLASLTGIISCVVTSLVWPGMRLNRFGAAMMVGFALATGLLGYAAPSLLALALIAAIVGLFLYSGIMGLYGTMVDTFESNARATGVGFVMGVGRASAALAPAAAGALFASGAARGTVCVLMASAALAAGMIIVFQEMPNGN